MAPDEADRYERKRDYDPDDPCHRLQLVKEIVAMANANGGTITIGEAEDHGIVGIDSNAQAALDPARLCDLVDSFIAGEHVELTKRSTPADRADHFLITIEVPRHPRPPLVFTKNGNYLARNGQQANEFRRGDIYVRKGTKAEPATRADFLRWINEAVEIERERWRSRVAFIAELPPDAELSFATRSDVPQDEPSAILTRAVPIWKRDRAKLLSSQELATLLLVRDSLAPDQDGQDLIIHSALRRRATLWHWLSDFMPSDASLKEILVDAIGGSDRDKSDAGASIVDVAALALEPADYQEVITALADSSYAHFREAAEEGTVQTSVVDNLKVFRERPLKGESLVDASDADLRAKTRELAGELVRPGRHTSETRQLNRVGLEVVARSPLGRSL
jgi:hypothetical protein